MDASPSDDNDVTGVHGTTHIFIIAILIMCFMNSFDSYCCVSADQNA